MKDVRWRGVVAGLVFVGGAAACALLLATRQRPREGLVKTSHGRPRERRPDGSYIVAVRDGREWRTCGELAFNRFYETREVDLAGLSGETTRVRLVKAGGGLAHIDSVTLAGSPPIEGEGADLGKLARRDDDVADASRGVTLAFETPASGAGTLCLNARVEAEVVGGRPLQFPKRNRCERVTQSSEFYTYEIGSHVGRLTVDGDISGESLGELFFNELVYNTSGHPQGRSFCWVMNDGGMLYVAFDFTPDNTMDGEADYVALYVKTAAGIREFRSSISETSWGRPGFAPTERAAYEHKVYEFGIGLEELDAPAPGTSIALALAAYGTVMQSDDMAEDNAVAYDPGKNQFLAAFARGANPNEHIHAQMFDSSGTAVGAEIAVSEAPYRKYEPAVAFNEYTGNHFVAWYRGLPLMICGRVVGGYGGPIGAEFQISDSTGDAASCAVAADQVNGKYLVVWQDYRSTTHNEIYGRIVDETGSFDSGQDGFIISDAVSSRFPDVAFDPVQEQYMVVWEDDVANEILGRLVASDGTVAGGAALQVSTPSASAKDNPAVAYDPTSQRWLVVWYEEMATDAVVGQVLDSTGTTVGGEFVVHDHTDDQDLPSVAACGGVFVVTWTTTEASGAARARAFDANGTAVSNVVTVKDQAAGIVSATANDATRRRCGVAWWHPATAGPALSVLDFSPSDSGDGGGCAPGAGAPAGPLAFGIFAGLWRLLRRAASRARASR